MGGSFELVPVYSYKRRKKIVNQQWKMYHEAGFKILIGYKRKACDVDATSV